MDSLRPSDPQQIGGYVLYGLLGAGGMGEVFFGRSPGGRAVAVKLIAPRYARDDEFRRRFRLEVEAGRRVGGFHAAQVVDADPDAARPWMVTAYVAGPSLKQVLAEQRALPPGSVRVLGAGLAEALAAIHDAGLIHRDLTPSNILLAYDGPHVIDFGVARTVDASAPTMQPGTPGFIAREVLIGQPATWACDVFSLGVVLAVASGITPYGKGEPEAITFRIVHGEPDLTGLDPQIRGLVEECLAKEPIDRPTPRQILERLGEHGPVAQWLPGPVLDMIPRYTPPKPTEVVPGLQRDSWLLEAERAARRVTDAYARAEAQVYVASVVSRFDRAHALRLLDDALRPTRQRDGTSFLSRQQMLRHLAGQATSELGTVLVRADATSASRMLDEIEDIIRSMIREEPGTAANAVTRLAETVASSDPARADRVARIPRDQGVQASAVARAAMVVARTDPAQAEQMARTISRLAGQATHPVAEPTRRACLWRWLKPKGAPHEVSKATAPLHEDSTRLWAARALAEVAVAMSSTSSLQPRRSPIVAEDVSTITAAGDLGAPVSAPAPAPMIAGPVDPARAERLLADAEELACGIAADDTRALALTAVKIAAARIDPDRAESSLTEAEQFARMSSSSSARDEALGEVALAAARTEPALAEQIAPSLLDRERTLAEVASAVAATDRARAERIAANITDEYVRALVMAEIAVRTDPAHAEPQLREALQAAHHDPAHMVEVALAAARTGSDRAEEIVRAIKSRDNIRTADFWRARALAAFVNISVETSPNPN
jgi:hypothetical protein